MAGSKRQQIVAAFQGAPAGFDVLILSPKAGGVGLTITAANHVIHLSRWWNPAVEDQATDRVYRIGQTRPVTIHLPLAVHPDPSIGPFSFDQRLDDLMDRKRALSRGLLVPPESDKDVDELLDGVLDGEGPEAIALLEEAASAEPEPAAEAQAIPSTRPSRPRLSLRTPVEAAETRQLELRRVEYREGGARDFAIFEQYTANAAILRLEVRDPYCCAEENSRRHLVNFIKRLDGKAGKVGLVQVVAYDADSVQKRVPESSTDQRRDLEQRWQRELPGVPLQFSQKSRRSAGDFHDRSIRASLANGDAVIWDLGRGIDGIMNPRRACTVNAFYERIS